MNTKEIFAQRIIELRKEKGITQAQLAERVCVSKTSANLYESATRVPDIQILARYAKELGVTSDYLLGLSNNRTAETAAIGDKLGLSDDAIKALSLLTDHLNQVVRDSRKTAQSIPEDRAKLLLYLNTKLWVINAIITKPLLSASIQQYLFGWSNSIIESIDYEKLAEQTPSSSKEKVLDEIKEANNALNMYRVQKELSELQKEYQQILPKTVDFDLVLEEDTNAQED